MNKDRTNGWSPPYEWRPLALLSLGFRRMGIDRVMIMPLFPIMMKDRGFGYHDPGYITGAQRPQPF